MSGALLRYRVMAYITGVLLIALVCVGVPLKYIAGDPVVVETVGQAHGIMYMVYLVVAYHLSHKCGWDWRRTIVVLLAGTIPFASFVAERKITHLVRAQHADQLAQPA